MQPIQINVQVQLSVSPELNALLSPIVASLQAGSTPTPVESKETKKPRTAKQPKSEVENQPAPEKEPETTQETEQETGEQKAKEYTEVDVRAAMDETRKRIEGADYKEKPDGEGYKKWHRVLTAWFKNTAATLGAEKPSALPDSESRRMFIACCEAVYVKDGELTEDCPY